VYRGSGQAARVLGLACMLVLTAFVPPGIEQAYSAGDPDRLRVVDVGAGVAGTPTPRAFLPLTANRTGATQTEGPVYCGSSPSVDPYLPDGYYVYFADEFDCGGLSPPWVRQGPMTAASYQPTAGGIVSVGEGRLTMAVPGLDVSFPYLYLIDDGATSYDVSFSDQRVDWVPDAGDFRLGMRVRFSVEALEEHRISIYADGHQPGWAGPLFYLGTTTVRCRSGTG